MKKLFVSTIASLLFAGTSYAACPSGTDNGNETINGKETCILSGVYKNSSLILTADKVWVLAGGVFIGDDNKGNSTLRIQAGTKIVGASGADFLVITRGSKIYAEGTSNNPILMTAKKATGRKRGEWGGLIINGNAPINGCAADTPLCEAEGEGSTGYYGGNDPEDDSGVLRYVVVEFAGYEITPENELNGIAFQGVGSKTQVNYIQVHMNADDGIEFFGGTVNVKHVVLTGNKDDSMDWTSGWRGKAQFVLVKQYDDQANNGIEADNLKSPMNAQPRSNPEISNITFIGTNSDAAKGGEGLLLRHGTAVTIHNAIVTGFKKSCIDIDDNETFNHGGVKTQDGVAAQGLKMVNSIVYCPLSQHFKYGETDKQGNPIVEPWNIESWFFGQAGNFVADPELNGYIPSANSIALGNGETPDDIFFDFVDYIGAFDGEDDDWTAKWTTNLPN